jgi:hypothetical protein
MESLFYLYAVKACFHKQINERARRCEAAHEIWVKPMRKGYVILDAVKVYIHICAASCTILQMASLYPLNLYQAKDKLS